MAVDGTNFFKRDDRAAFWIMMLLGFILLVYSYAINRVIDWLLGFVIVIGCFIFIFRFTHVVAFIRRRSWMMEIEKAERIAFWGMSLTSLVALILAYATMNLFNCNLFLVLIFGLLTKIVALLLRYF